MNETLVNFRNSKKMSQIQFARHIGVSPSYYSKIELAERNPSYNFLKKLKESFEEVDLDKLFFTN